MTSEGPAGRRGPGSGIRAESPGLDRGLEVLGEIWAVLVDQLDRGPDRLRHADARPLRGRGEGPVTASQPDCTRELLSQEVDLVRQPGGALGVAPLARLLEVFLELLESPAVVLLCLIVEHGLRVGRPGTDNIVLGEPRANVGWMPRRGTRELEGGRRGGAPWRRGRAGGEAM